MNSRLERLDILFETRSQTTRVTTRTITWNPSVWVSVLIPLLVTFVTTTANIPSIQATQVTPGNAYAPLMTATPAGPITGLELNEQYQTELLNLRAGLVLPNTSLTQLRADVDVNKLLRDEFALIDAQYEAFTTVLDYYLKLIRLFWPYKIPKFNEAISALEDNSIAQAGLVAKMNVVALNQRVIGVARELSLPVPRYIHEVQLAHNRDLVLSAPPILANPNVFRSFADLVTKTVDTHQGWKYENYQKFVIDGIGNTLAIQLRELRGTTTSTSPYMYTPQIENLEKAAICIEFISESIDNLTPLLNTTGVSIQQQAAQIQDLLNVKSLNRVRERLRSKYGIVERETNILSIWVEEYNAEINGERMEKAIDNLVRKTYSLESDINAATLRATLAEHELKIYEREKGNVSFSVSTLTWSAGIGVILLILFYFNPTSRTVVEVKVQEPRTQPLPVVVPPVQPSRRLYVSIPRQQTPQCHTTFNVDDRVVNKTNRASPVYIVRKTFPSECVASVATLLNPNGDSTAKARPRNPLTRSADMTQPLQEIRETFRFDDLELYRRAR